MGVEICFDDYLESVVANCHESLRLYTLIDDDREQSQPDFFELKMQVVQPQPETKKGSEQEADKKDQNAEPPMPDAEPPMPVLEIYKYAQDHVLLMGKAGSGKSTALQQLLLNKAKEAQILLNKAKETQRNSEALIPVLVKLRSWQSFPSVIALIKDALETGIQRRLNEETIIDLLFAGRLLLLVDGVNELPSYFQDRNPSNEVEAFRKKYRKTPMIFTNRVLGASRNLGISKQMEMLPLSDREMRQFIERCLPQQSEQMLNRLGERLRRLGETPLLLSMLCYISRQREDGLPANLGSPFREFAEIYDHKIQENIPVDDKYKRWVLDLLQQLAFAMMPQNDPYGLRREIHKFEAEKILVKLLYDESRDYAKQCLENLSKYHLIQEVKTDQKIKFCHQSIQDYYAAEYLWRQLEDLTPEKLQKNYLNYVDWTDSLELMLGFEDREEQALRVVRLALDVDLRLGAKLAGAVEYKFQKKTIEMLIREIEEQKIPKLYAIELLGDTKSDVAITFLIQSLENEKPYLRINVVKALGKIFSNKVIEPLIHALKDVDFYVSKNAAEILGKVFSAKIIEPLLQALKDDNFHVRGNASEILGKIGSDKAINPLIQALKDEHPYVRRYVAEALGKIGSNKAVEALIQALKDENSRVRCNAAEALGRIGSNKAIIPLIQALKDLDLNVIWTSIEALNKLGYDTDGDPFIQSMLKDAELIRLNNDKVLESLNQDLKKQDDKMYSQIESSFSFDNDIESLIQSLNNEDYFVRIDIVEVLRMIADRNLPTLTQQLPHLLTLIPTESSQQALSVITAIQARCKYYNYDIAQTPLPPEDNPNPTTGNTYNFYDKVGQVVENLTVRRDNIATQNNQNVLPES